MELFPYGEYCRDAHEDACRRLVRAKCVPIAEGWGAVRCRLEEAGERIGGAIVLSDELVSWRRKRG